MLSSPNFPSSLSIQEISNPIEVTDHKAKCIIQTSFTESFQVPFKRIHVLFMRRLSTNIPLIHPFPIFANFPTLYFHWNRRKISATLTDIQAATEKAPKEILKVAKTNDPQKNAK